TATASSDGVTVDASAPTAGTVNDGTGPDKNFQSSTSTLSANWSGFSDPQSGIASYDWAIGTTPGGTNVQAFSAVGASTSATVRATNGAGLSVLAISNGVLVDTATPVAGTVRDGTGADLDFQSSTGTLSANWSGFSAPSGITAYSWAIGSTPGGTQIQGFVG